MDSDRILASHFVLVRKYLAGKSSQGPIASSTRQNNKIDDIITARKRSLGQGNIFTPVCHSVHKGGSASVHAGIPPTPDQAPPLDQAPPEQTPPGTRHPLGPGTSTGQGTPWNRPPWNQVPFPHQAPPGPGTPQDQAPPGAEHAGRYGQRVGGTHPTGMQSCYFVTLSQHGHGEFLFYLPCILL